MIRKPTIHKPLPGISLVITLLFLLTSCAMSTMQTPLVTPQGNIMYTSSAVLTGEVMDPEWNIPIWISTGIRYGIIENLDTGISFFGDAAVADLKYGFIQNRENGLNVALRAGGGYGLYSLSYSTVEPIVGWNYQDIAMPYLSLRTMSHWNHSIHTFSPAIGVSFLPTEDFSFIMEGRFYVELPGSNHWRDVELPEYIGDIEFDKDMHLVQNIFSFHIGVSVNFDPYFFF